MIKLIILILFIIVLVFFPFVRCIVLNPHYSAYYSCVDLFHYIKYKLFNVPKYGELIAYTGLFGRGKTLSMVHDVCAFYKRYNDKITFDRVKKVNKVIVLSNVTLNIPYIHLSSLQQIVDYLHEFYDNPIDGINPILYICIDEASTQLNSRNFKTNFNALFLNTLLTCRHYNVARFVYTSQRFSHVDALLRQVTQSVYDCDKIWRCQLMRKYDAYELENCTNPSLLKPLSIRFWFVRDKDFKAYDTYACVDNLIHDFEDGSMVSETEILNALNPSYDVDNVSHFSRLASHRKKFSKRRG